MTNLRRAVGAFLIGTTVALTACTTTELGDFVEVGVTAATGDAERGSRARAAADAGMDSRREVDVETERSLGAGIGIQAIEEIGPLYPDNAVQEYVNLVGLAVARQSSRPDLPYAFAVLENDTPNAFAGPGGYVFVTTGALKLMRDESDLAGVLAHEVAHVTERHILQTYRRNRMYDMLAEGAAAASKDATRYSDAVSQGKDVLLEKGLNPEFEYDADLVGVQVAAMAGYDPRGLVNFLTRMGGSDRDGGWLRTHPSTQARIQRINKLIDEDLGGATGATNAERFAAEVENRL